jgi:hydrogenase-4 component B
MNALGGLAKRMPLTAAAAVVACIAIAALPPLNGFVSEWLLYRGVIGGLAESPSGPEAPLAVAILAIALTGALALAAFVKFFGILFLGQERSDAAAGAHDPSPAMLVPMGALAALCLAIGVVPRLALAPIERGVRQWSGDTFVDAAAMTSAISSLAAVSVVSVATIGVACALVLWLRQRRGVASRSGTWDCGYAIPSPRMQYSESSLAALIVGLFEGFLRPRWQRPDHAAEFPAASAYKSETPDVVLDRGVLPLVEYATRALMWLRLMQQGRVQMHVLYILLGLVVLLVVGR